MEWKSEGEGSDSERKPSRHVSTHLTINHIPLGTELKTCDNWSGLIIRIAKGMIYPSESKAKLTVKASPFSLYPPVCLSHTFLPNVSLKMVLCIVFIDVRRAIRCHFISPSLQNNILKKCTSSLQQILRTS